MADRYSMTQSLTHGEYALAFAEFRNCTTEYESTVAWVKSNVALFNFAQLQHVLSVGGGTGNFDMMLYALMPRVKTYTVIEPNQEHIDAFKKETGENPVFKFVNANFSPTLQPGTQDLVLLSHCLYYMDRDVVLDAISKYARSALILHNSEFGIDKLKKLFVPDHPYRYSSVDLEVDLRRRHNNFVKYRIDSHVDVVNPKDDLINFFLEHKATEQKKSEVKQYLLNHCPNGKMYHPVDVIKIDFE